MPHSNPLDSLEPGSGQNRFSTIVALGLLSAAGITWVALEYAMPFVMNPSGMTMGSGVSLMTLSLSVVSLSLFEFVWVVGMVAMMFPAMIPVLSMYSTLEEPREGKASRIRSFAGSSIFMGGYLLLYALLGLALFASAYAVFLVSSLFSWPASASMAASPAVLFLAGIWQISPLKDKTLTKCISPFGFFLTRRKEGLGGAFRMGAEHGLYCVGCCWLYMLVMLVVAAMSLISMALLSGLIILEKAFFGGKAWFKWTSGGVFFTLALVSLVFPSLHSL